MAGAKGIQYSRFLDFHGRNPDILNSIANLSNDEVFTPPEFANRMLDTLAKGWAESNSGEDIWSNSKVTFLDPFTKSGVFLREIATRLIDGLDKEIPDLQARVDHILTKQVFGIATTELTSLMARRSLYCSKKANGKHSVTKKFNTEAGNIWFEPLEHTWVGGKTKVLTMDKEGNEIEKALDGKCKYCGASKLDFDRADGLELHAYGLIHNDDPKKWVQEVVGDEMQFDVIIGNPPYHLETGGAGSQARPIYQLFVDGAMALNPKMVCMVIPSRWFSGGMGLSSFRSKMLESRRISHLVDFVLDKDAFPSINLNGGACYFLWRSDYQGECEFTSVQPGGSAQPAMTRDLSEFDLFIRQNEALGILRKVLAFEGDSFQKYVSTIDPFGFPTKFHGAPERKGDNVVKLYGSRAVSWIRESQVSKNQDLVPLWKVLVPRASDGNEVYPLPIWDLKGPFLASPGEVCSWTYLVAFSSESESEAESVRLYMRTKFFRFLVSLRKPTQDNKAENFAFVPQQNFESEWTDERLYEKYGLTESEAEHIEKIIRDLE